MANYPSKASHGCFGTDKRFSIGQFVGDASELSNAAEWKTVTKRNQNGKISAKEAEEISNLKRWNDIPRRGMMKKISFEVAPNVNDHHDQVHSKIMKQSRNRNPPKAKSNQKKSIKKEKLSHGKEDFEKLIQAAKFQNHYKDINETEEFLVQSWKNNHGKNQNMKKNGDMTEFEDFIKKINETEVLLTQESNTIEESLKQAETSTKRCADLLLVQKGLYRKLLEFKVARLPHYWNEFWVHYPKSLPHCYGDTQDKFQSMVKKTVAKIDKTQKYVGQLDVKVFHALDLKKEWNDTNNEDLPLDSDFFDEEAHISCSFDSDDSFKQFDDDDFDVNWERLDMCAPDICHTCRFIGHSRQKCPDIGKVKARNLRHRQKYCEVANTMNRKKHENKPKQKNSPHVPFTNHCDPSHEELKQLTTLLAEHLDSKKQRQAREDYYRMKSDFRRSQNMIDETYHIIARKLNDFITEGAWLDKEIIKIQKKIDKIRKEQGNTRVVRAFMTVAFTLPNDPASTIANVSTSLIQTTSDDSNVLPSTIDNTSNVRSIPTATDDDEELLLSNVPSENMQIKLQNDMFHMQEEFQQVLQL